MDCEFPVEIDNLMYGLVNNKCHLDFQLVFDFDIFSNIGSLLKIAYL